MTIRHTMLVVATLLLGAESPPAVAVDWNQALTTYARDPYRNRRALLALRRADPDALPPPRACLAPYAIALLDAAERPGAATQLEVVAADEQATSRSGSRLRGAKGVKASS